MKTAMIRSVILLEAFLAVSFFGQSCSNRNETRLSSSSSQLSRGSRLPQLVESIREDGINYDYTAVFSTPGMSDVAIRMECDEPDAASAVLGIDAKTIQSMTLQEFAELQQQPLLRLSDETVKSPGSLGLTLSCKPDQQGDDWNLLVTADLDKIYLTLDKAKGRYLSFSSKCEGLKAGFEIPRLLKGVRTGDIVVAPETMGIKEEYAVGCGSYKPVKAQSPNWSLGYTNDFEVFLIDKSGTDVTAIELKALDKTAANQVAEQLLFPDSELIDLNASIAQLKSIMGIESIESFSSASDVPGAIANIKLDLCAQTCGAAFNPEHLIDGSPTIQMNATQDRDLEGNFYVDWQYQASSSTLRFKQCGKTSLASLLGLKVKESDWTAENQSSQWIDKAEKNLRESLGVKSISCFREAEQVCVLPPISQPTLASKKNLSELFSLAKCENKNARILELHLLSKLTLDAKPLELSLDGLRTKTQNTSLNTIRIIGKTDSAAIVSQLSCKNGRLLCAADPSSLLPAIRVQSGVNLELRNVSIYRGSDADADRTHIGIESLAGGRVLLDRTRVGLSSMSSSDLTEAFDIGFRTSLSNASIINSDIVAKQVGVDVNDSKVVIYDSQKERNHYIAPAAMPIEESKLKLPDDGTETIGHIANIRMSGQQSALFVKNQSLVGPYALRTAGKATARLTDATFFGTKAKERESWVVRDDNGGSSISLIGGRISNFDRLLYLTANGTVFTVVLPELLRFNSCYFDDKGNSYAFQRETHIVGARQTNLANIRVSPRDNRCENEP